MFGVPVDRRKALLSDMGDGLGIVDGGLGGTHCE